MIQLSRDIVTTAATSVSKPRTAIHFHKMTKNHNEQQSSQQPQQHQTGVQQQVKAAPRTAEQPHRFSVRV